MSLVLEITDSIQQVDAQNWDDLVGDMPLLSHAFLSALERSGSVGKGTGWQPYPMIVYEDGQLAGIMPLYVKSHSYGEYVFDWAWADAYQRSGFNYYPKLLSAIPFTPITSQRFIANNAKIQALMIDALGETMHKHQLSSAHVLFPEDDSAAALKQAGWLQRHGVQFRWQNENFTDFEDFLSTLSHDKRKKIHQERKKVAATGVECLRVKGADITPEQWSFFYACYENTYLEHHSTPYLTPAFFQQIGQSMPQNILLILAYLDGKPIASALNIYHQTTLYGRYWGALQYVPNLHFELCYYQAQEFCITENIQYFEGGAQGEHKLARGFKPRPTCSFHKIAHPDFANAIQDFVAKESQGIAAYTNELEERAPFKVQHT
ncbi:GNAT family N-acetyltransferase [Methylotenera sp.]|uniref:GNAT family N-acetyltransferase n=1 Tax=Methylotenera sp. TaxID=2051956 RepID=UPI00271DFB43|nr:GNAT family N-acetyltransferase [Methylotenera sp.]MDO9206172.1 GNAT family N-acetyltransferase [Methylotenera sp.]MDP1523718.1 GNAT family N-acetyltransferase [Methylotenera sp.]MDP2070902.1 GNAT family N-acetyltransferase [Methylotenera sp.]MDP2230256.1 GNAT family N-acetyltransferase [Methylotenera sp.]MDP3005776.1 GNAT family N-acetyltransferase [Methylotenera sp.]